MKIDTFHSKGGIHNISNLILFLGSFANSAILISSSDQSAIDGCLTALKTEIATLILRVLKYSNKLVKSIICSPQ
jgi:hypothetical protein